MKHHDKFNKKYDRIYRLEADDYAKLPPVVGQRIKEELPEVKEIALFADGGKQFITYSPDKDPENVEQI